MRHNSFLSFIRSRRLHQAIGHIFYPGSLALAHGAQESGEIEPIKGETKGSIGGIEDGQVGKRERFSCHHPTRALELRKEYTDIFLYQRREMFKCRELIMRKLRLVVSFG